MLQVVWKRSKVDQGKIVLLAGDSGDKRWSRSFVVVGEKSRKIGSEEKRLLIKCKCPCREPKPCHLAGDDRLPSFPCGSIFGAE